MSAVYRVRAMVSPRIRHPAVIVLSIVCLLAASASPSSASAKKHGRPALVVKRVSTSAASVPLGGSLTLGDWTKNVGKTRAKPSKTTYLLSVDTRSGGTDPMLGKRRIPRLLPGHISKGSLSVTFGPSIGVGVYHVIACTNYRGKPKGRKHKRKGRRKHKHKGKGKCRVAPGTVTVTTPVKALSAPCVPNAGSPVSGIDVSDYQGSINFAQVAGSGVRFVFAAADDGMISRTLYPSYKAGAESAGLAFGAYDFFEPGQDPVAQANKFLADAALGSGNLLPVLDVEGAGGMSPSTLMEHLSAWLKTVQDALGVRPLIYTAKSIWDPDVEAGLAAEGYPLWVASWAAPPPVLPSEWSDWEFWQYSDHGSVPGISIPVDLDRFNGGTPCTIP